jgi:hypothetical protein
MNDRSKPNADGGSRPPVDPKMLAGGYAAGNLTDAEQRRLLEEALQRQDLFDELMAEQPLKDLLEDDGIRSEVIQALQKQPSRWDQFRFWWSRPWAWGTAGALATGLLVVAFFGTNPPSLLQDRAQMPETQIVLRDSEPVPPGAGEESAGQPTRDPSSGTRQDEVNPLVTLPDAPAAEGASRRSSEAASSPLPKAAPSSRPKRELAGGEARPATVATPAARKDTTGSTQLADARRTEQEPSRSVAAAPEPSSSAAGAAAPSVQASAVSKAAEASSPEQNPARVAEQRKAVREEATAARDATRSRFADAAPQAGTAPQASALARSKETPSEVRARLVPATPTSAGSAGLSPSTDKGATDQGTVVTLLRQTSAGGFEPVASGQAVAPNEGLKLQLTPAASGWVTLQRRDQAGRVDTISERQRVERGTTAVIPSQGTFAATVGPQTLTLRFVAEEPAAAPPPGGLQKSLRLSGGARMSAVPGQPAVSSEAAKSKQRESGGSASGAGTAGASKQSASAAEGAAGSPRAVLFEIRVVGRPQ